LGAADSFAARFDGRRGGGVMAAPPSSARSAGQLAIRAARQADGPEIWRLVRDSESLELNSCYAYLVLCRDFGHTSVVAELDGRVVGFVVGYCPPNDPEVVFVWQVGVDGAARGRGIAGKLLRALVALPGCKAVRFLETTVTPDNQPSLKLFSSFARGVDAAIERVGGFGEEDFRYQPHEREDRYRIGPFGTE
jgi:L-2,4-diaminobutyric acid acetyltransferase